MNDQTDTFTIGAAADLLGISVRTLRHWDDIGLLSPQWRTWGGHRLYLPEDLHRAHRILVYREAGMSLQQVKQLLDEEQSEKSALIAQRDILASRICDLQHMLGTIDELLEGIDMNKPLTPREAAAKFGITWRQDWQDEAESRWSGSETWEQSQRQQAKFSESDWQSQADGHEKIKRLLVDALANGIDPDSEVGREVSAAHRDWVSQHYDCSRSRQVLLARMYLHDERFRAAYDGNNEADDPKNPGVTDWLVAAIEADARAHGIDPDTASWD